MTRLLGDAGIFRPLLRSATYPVPAQLALPATLASFLLTRVAVGLCAWAGASQLAAAHAPAPHRGLFVTTALMWDGAWYEEIAAHGYMMPPHGSASLAFPPLLPLLARLLGPLLDQYGLNAGDPANGALAVAGILISNGAFFAALYLLWQLIAADHPAAIANWTLWLVAAFPLGVFWSTFYTESLFLLLVVGCLLAARRERWWWAGVLGGLAALTRWAGVLLAVVLLVEWMTLRQTPGTDPRRPPWAAGVRRWALRGRQAAPQDDVSGATRLQARRARTVGAGHLGRVREPRSEPAPGRDRVQVTSLGGIALIPLALVGYMLFLRAAFARPLGMFTSHAQTWHEQLTLFPLTYVGGAKLLWQQVVQTGPLPATGSILAAVAEQGHGSTLYMWLDLGLPLLFVGLGGLGWRRGWLRPGDVSWLGLGVVFALSWNTTLSVGRYMMPLWPALIVGAYLCRRWPWLGRIWLVGSGALLALTAYLFASAKWIG